MVARRKVSAKTPWGDIMGYSRAVEVGKIITVSGTTATDASGSVVGRGDVHAQTVYAIEKIEAALKELGASLDDVVRTRIFTTDVSLWKEIARAHGKFFGKTKPANTLVEVSKLIDKDLLIEIEADAIKQ